MNCPECKTEFEQAYCNQVCCSQACQKIRNARKIKAARLNREQMKNQKPLTLSEHGDLVRQNRQKAVNAAKRLGIPE